MQDHRSRLTLVRAAILAGGVTMGLALATPATAAPLCSGDNTVDSICLNFFPGEGVARSYWFDTDEIGNARDHLLRITIDAVNEEFGLRFNRVLREPGYNFGLDDWVCVPYGPGDQCIEYQTPSSTEPNGTPSSSWYSGQVTWLIAWSRPIATSPVPEIVHAEGDSNDFELLEGVFFDPTLGPDAFSCDLPYYDTCFSEFARKFGDPVRAAKSDNFSKSGLVTSAVPEPGTMALLGAGLSGYALNVRRRRRERAGT